MPQLKTTHTTAGRLLLAVFFLSGVTALLYQVAWLKYLGLVFGNTVHAAATLVAIFLAGLGIGGFLFGKVFPSRRPLVTYAVLEAVIGAIGAFSPNAFALLDDAYVASFHSFTDAPMALAIARALLASLFLLPPTILMGGTLPVLVRWFTERSETNGRAVASLYAANTFGATAGVALAGFAAIPLIGLVRTIGLAVAVNFLLAIGALAISWFLRERSAGEQASVSWPKWEHPASGRAVLLASFLMGLTAIADEVFWTRILVLHLGSSVYAFSLMLFGFLIGLAIGSAAIYAVIDRVDPLRLLGRLQILLAATLAVQVIYFTSFVDVLESFAAMLPAPSYGTTLVAFLGAVLSAILLPTAIMGATFPLAVRLYSATTRQEESKAVGVVYLVNTVGSISGSLLAGFVLIRTIGSQNGLFLMATVNLAIGIFFLLRGAPARRLGTALTASAATAVVLASFLFVRPNQVLLSAGLFADRASDILVFREDVSATVALRDFGAANLSLELNGVNVAGTAPDLIGTQKLQGHLPLLIHPDPSTVLHIGFGSGGTAWAVSLHPVEEIRIAEISPEVLELSGAHLSMVNHGVLRDPRVKVEINDGRNFILATRQKFDVILSDSIHPRYAGNGTLYTRDYFALCREKLAPGGIVSMWLPMYSLTSENYLMILRAFHDVFPNTTVWYVPNSPNAFTIVIGRMEEGPIPLDRIRSRMSGAVAGELAEIGIADEYDLAAALLLDPPAVEALTRGVGPHVDDRPAVEYESGRLIDRDGSWLQNFSLLARAASPLARAFTDGEGMPGRLEATEDPRLTTFRTHFELLYEKVTQGR